MACAAGVGLSLGALNVRYRDVSHVVPFLVQLGLCISPVGYSASIVPERWRLAYAFNPLVGIIDGFRWCLLAGQTKIYPPSLFFSVAISIALFAFGLRQFRRMENSFADLI